jgi:hypothetical protein
MKLLGPQLSDLQDRGATVALHLLVGVDTTGQHRSYWSNAAQKSRRIPSIDVARETHSLTVSQTPS